MENSSKRQRELHQSVSIQHISGPLPSPDALAKYDQVVPGAAERIIKMAEQEAKHRQNEERKSHNAFITLTLMSPIFALIVIMLIGWLVYTCIEKGYPKEGVAIAIGCMASVGGLFFWMRKQKKS